MPSDAARPIDTLPRAQLWTEFTALFVVAPILMAVLLPPDWMFPALLAVMALGLGLLARTPGFRWRDLVRWSPPFGWPLVFGVALATFVFGGLVIALTAPEAAFVLVRERPTLLVMILLLYPVLSALPQEIVFRPLFFRRYGALLPAGRAAILSNGAIFALAHLMYWNVIVLMMTFAGGLLFAHAYETRQNFPLAVMLHAVAGNLIFVLGLGVYFYSGNVVRPF